jgi:hypothetical protein
LILNGERIGRSEYFPQRLIEVSEQADISGAEFDELMATTQKLNSEKIRDLQRRIDVARQLITIKKIPQPIGRGIFHECVILRTQSCDQASNRLIALFQALVNFLRSLCSG